VVPGSKTGLAQRDFPRVVLERSWLVEQVKLEEPELASVVVGIGVKDGMALEIGGAVN
jgi:hypothetical protein